MPELELTLGGPDEDLSTPSFRWPIRRSATGDSKVSGEPTAANDSQSFAPPNPFWSVIVTEPFGATVAESIVMDGGGVIVSITGFDVPPPGGSVTTVISTTPALVKIAAGNRCLQPGDVDDFASAVPRRSSEAWRTR